MKYIWFVPSLIILLLIVYGYFRIRKFSREIFGVVNLVEGLKNQRLENSLRPKSLNSMEPVLLPRIRSDFPGLNVEELKARAERILLSSFRALASKDIGLLSEDSDKEIHGKILTQIQELRDNKTDMVFKDIRIHKTVVSDYKKDKGQVWITLQSALEGIIYTSRDGLVVEGDKDYLTQAVYRLYYLYVQDPNLVKDRDAIGLNCPNCGAPVKNLGDKYCLYCGSGISEVNLRVWRMLDFKRE
ncbi:MAG: zinc ribbon domain-containing protein [Tissierellia bacterium]|nr:zinc ribbon domain-containing protein [Tissierellia bacterium]